MTDSNKVATPATDQEVGECKIGCEKILMGIPQGFLGIARSRATKELKLIARIESDRLSLAEKETEITRLRGLLYEQVKWFEGHGWAVHAFALRKEIDRASKGVTNE